MSAERRICVRVVTEIQSRSAIRRQAPMRWRRERLRDLDLA